MGDLRVKTMYLDDRQVNDFIGQKDIEVINMYPKNMEVTILYKKIKKGPVKSGTNDK